MPTTRARAGTNFLVRARAFREAGGSPTYTLTEDFALGMEMAKWGWRCRYVQEYLAIGEAPTEIRNCFQQRSRWTKGVHPTLPCSNPFLIVYLHVKPPSAALGRRARRAWMRGKRGAYAPRIRRGAQHFQIILNLRRCPLFQFRLRPFDRIMYCSGVWSYIVGAVTTFTFLLIPLLTIWIGAAPLDLLRCRPPRPICLGSG